MKRLLFIILAIVLPTTILAQTTVKKNCISLEYGPYVIYPKLNKQPGDKYNGYLNPPFAYGSFGVTYNRSIVDSKFRLKSGMFLANYFHLLALQIPFEFKGNIIGNMDTTLFYMAYNAGFGLNFFVTDNPSGFKAVYDYPIVEDYNVKVNKNFYVAPQLGLSLGFNLGWFSIEGMGYLNYPIPKIVEYQTKYKENETDEKYIEEVNYNGRWGFTFRLALGVRF